MPVLPEVGSISVDSPGLIFPAASIASIMPTPIRSLTLDVGLKNSSLASKFAFTPLSLAILSRRTIGVSPIVSVIDA